MSTCSRESSGGVEEKLYRASAAGPVIIASGSSTAGGVEEAAHGAPVWAGKRSLLAYSSTARSRSSLVGGPGWSR